MAERWRASNPPPKNDVGISKVTGKPPIGRPVGERSEFERTMSNLAAAYYMGLRDPKFSKVVDSLPSLSKPEIDDLKLGKGGSIPDYEQGKEHRMARDAIVEYNRALQRNEPAARVAHLIGRVHRYVGPLQAMKVYAGVNRWMGELAQNRVYRASQRGIAAGAANRSVQGLGKLKREARKARAAKRAKKRARRR